MRKRRLGGCLTALILVVALALAAVLIYTMLRPGEPGEETLVDQALHAVGIGGKKDEETGTAADHGENGGQTAHPAENGSADGEEDEGETHSPISELPSEEAVRVEITQEKLRELLEDAMEDSFPVTLSDLTISADSTVALTGSMEREKIISFLESQEDSGLRSYAILLRLAPSKVDLYGKVKLGYDAARGQIDIDPQKLTLASFDVPTSLLPASMTDSLNRAMTNFFASYGRTPAAVNLYDGYMTVYFE